MGRLLENLSKRIREGDLSAIYAAQELGPDAAEVLPALMQWLDRESGITVLAINAIGAMGQKAASAQKRLRTMLDNELDEGIQVVLGKALLRIGDADAEDAVVKLLSSSNEIYRELAALALYEFGYSHRDLGERVLRELASETVAPGRAGELAQLVFKAKGCTGPADV